MIKATGTGPDGKPTLFIGLSHGNLDKFREAPLDSYIKIDGKELGLPFNVFLFSGETEAAMADMVMQNLVPGAKVHISDRLKS
jgi:hypothetical protein